MTAPVTTFEDNESYSMLFYMLESDEIKDLPNPSGQNITLDKFNLGKLVFSINFYQSCVIFNINKHKTSHNNTIYNHKLDHEIKDMTFQHFLNHERNFLGNIKLIKNFLRIYSKYKINKYLKKIFN